LNDKIHEYHNHTARDLWKIYEQMGDPSMAVLIALAKGIINIEDVQENCREWVEIRSEFFQLHSLYGSKTT